MRSRSPLNTSTSLISATSQGIFGPYTAIAARTVTGMPAAADNNEAAWSASQCACSSRSFMLVGPCHSCRWLLVRTGIRLSQSSESMANTPAGPITRWSICSSLSGMGRMCMAR